MAQLKIIEKGDFLTHAHIPICLETDIGYGPSRQYYSHYVLCDDILALVSIQEVLVLSG